MDTKSILKWALILSIVIVLNLFFNFAIALVYDQPDYEDFCGENNIPTKTEITTETTCLANDGQWTARSENNITITTKPDGTVIESPNSEGWCDPDFTCRENYEDAMSSYNKNVFIILITLGLISLSIGIFTSIAGSAVSLGLAFGGVLSFLIASMRYWSDMDDWLRVVILGLALIALIIIGIKKFKD